eukprot:848655-Prymnesium_polylepis.1
MPPRPYAVLFALLTLLAPRPAAASLLTAHAVRPLVLAAHARRAGARCSLRQSELKEARLELKDLRELREAVALQRETEALLVSRVLSIGGILWAAALLGISWRDSRRRLILAQEVEAKAAAAEAAAQVAAKAAQEAEVRAAAEREALRAEREEKLKAAEERLAAARAEADAAREAARLREEAAEAAEIEQLSAEARALVDRVVREQEQEMRAAEQAARIAAEERAEERRLELLALRAPRRRKQLFDRARRIAARVRLRRFAVDEPTDDDDKQAAGDDENRAAGG